MGMTIEEARKIIISGSPNDDNFSMALVIAIDTLKNVKLLKEILKSYEREGLKSIEISRVRMVLKNGNDD